MPQLANSRSAARLIFIIGLIFMFLGSVFLIGSPDGVSMAAVVASLVLIASGIGCAIFALRINHRSQRLFFAALFLQAGIFLFFIALGLLPFSFAQAWPLLSVFVGTALLPAGWRRYGALRPNYAVLSVAFITLGAFLMVFSLDIVDFSLSHFLFQWWPLLALLSGLVLVLATLGSRIDQKKRGAKGERRRRG